MSTQAPTFEAVFRSRIAKVEEDARKVGMNLTAICKEAGISRATPDRWKRGTPRTIEIVDQMEKIVARKSSEAAKPI